MFCDQKFQLIVPVGVSCINSYNLRRLNLQIEAMPFDWVRDVSLPLAMEFLANRFQDYIVKEKLAHVNIDANSPYTFSMPSGIIFVHDFHSSNLDNEFDNIFEKYQRRISRLYRKIQDSRSILFVHASCTRLEPEEVKTLISHFINAFPHKKVKMLYLYIGGDVEGAKYTYKSDLLDMAEIYQNGDEYSWTGSPVLFDMILKNYRLDEKNVWFRLVKKRAEIALLRVLVGVCCCCLPVKKIRHQLRNWYNFKFVRFGE